MLGFSPNNHLATMHYYHRRKRTFIQRAAATVRENLPFYFLLVLMIIGATLLVADIRSDAVAATPAVEKTEQDVSKPEKKKLLVRSNPLPKDQL